MISSLLNDLWRISLCVIYNVLDQSFKCCSSNRYCINGTLFKIVLLEQTQRITAFTMCNQKTCSQANRMTECCRLLILLLLNYWTYLSGQLNRDTSKKTDELSNKKNCRCLTSQASSLEPGRPTREGNQQRRITKNLAIYALGQLPVIAILICSFHFVFLNKKTKS